MQPSQTIVSPIAKQCLEGMACRPSLWSLEPLGNAKIILGFHKSQPPSPPHLRGQCAYTHKHSLLRAKTRDHAC